MSLRRDRLNVYFEPATAKALEELAIRRHVSKSAIVDAAVSAFLSLDGADRRRPARSAPTPVRDVDNNPIAGLPYISVICTAPLQYHRGFTYPNGMTTYVATPEHGSLKLLKASQSPSDDDLLKSCDDADPADAGGDKLRPCAFWPPLAPQQCVSRRQLLSPRTEVPDWSKCLGPGKRPKRQGIIPVLPNSISRALPY